MTERWNELGQGEIDNIMKKVYASDKNWCEVLDKMFNGDIDGDITNDMVFVSSDELRAASINLDNAIAWEKTDCCNAGEYEQFCYDLDSVKTLLECYLS